MPGYRGESYEDRKERVLRYREDRKLIRQAQADKTPKTAEYIKELHDKWLNLRSEGKTNLAFSMFANIDHLDSDGWEATGQWPPPKKVNICIVCETELEPVQYDSIAQPYGGSEIRIHHCFGSRYDFIGFRNPIHEPGFHAHALAILNGEEPPPFEQKTSCGIIGSEPKEIPKEALRVHKLAACSHILGVLCDDCFEKKAHLFKGYEEKNDKLNLIVD